MSGGRGVRFSAAALEALTEQQNKHNFPGCRITSSKSWCPLFSDKIRESNNSFAITNNLLHKTMCIGLQYIGSI
jgi:hypothetical protein